MKVTTCEIGSFKINFDDNEMALLLAADDHLYQTPEEVITTTLTEAFRIMATTFESQNKLQKAVEKFNRENETQLGIDSMRELLNRRGL
jgi:hypothetical protein